MSTNDSSPGHEVSSSKDETAERRGWRLEDLISTICLALLAVITLLNVVIRYLTDVSFAWTEELSVFLMVLMVFSGAASVALRDQHLRIEVLYSSGSSPRKKRLEVLSRGATALTFLVLAILIGRTAWDEFRYHELHPLFDLPRWCFTACLGVLCILTTWRSLKVSIWRNKGAR